MVFPAADGIISPTAVPYISRPSRYWEINDSIPTIQSETGTVLKNSSRPSWAAGSRAVALTPPARLTSFETAASTTGTPSLIESYSPNSARESGTYRSKAEKQEFLCPADGTKTCPQPDSDFRLKKSNGFIKFSFFKIFLPRFSARNAGLRGHRTTAVGLR